jgi:hypothetical protein
MRLLKEYNMNIITWKTLTASVVFGLHRGYKEEIIPLTEVKKAIMKVQQELKDELSILLSVKMSPCEILFLGQEEPSMTLEFIQYPKFLYDETLWEAGVTLFTKKLMGELEQNRTVIVLPDKTLMLENSNEIDPRIKLS